MGSFWTKYYGDQSLDMLAEPLQLAGQEELDDHIRRLINPTTTTLDASITAETAASSHPVRKLEVRITGMVM